MNYLPHLSVITAGFSTIDKNVRLLGFIGPDTSATLDKGKIRAYTAHLVLYYTLSNLSSPFQKND